MTNFNFHSTAEEVTDNIDLTGQTFLITGVNSGLGKESARILGMQGATIIACARTVEKHKAPSMNKIPGSAVACDLSDLHSVSAAIERIHSLNTPIQCIMANAGIMALPTLHQKNGIELQFYTNHVGHFHLVTNLVDQLTDNGRVVILSSRAHAYARPRGLELDNLSGEQDYHDWRMYGRSKLANILFARELNRRLADTNKRANSVHPGVIRTNLGRYVPDREAMYKQIEKTIPLKTIPQGTAPNVCRLSSRLEGVGGEYSDCQIADTIPQGKTMRSRG